MKMLAYYPCRSGERFRRAGIVLFMLASLSAVDTMATDVAVLPRPITAADFVGVGVGDYATAVSMARQATLSNAFGTSSGFSLITSRMSNNRVTRDATRVFETHLDPVPDWLCRLYDLTQNSDRTYTARAVVMCEDRVRFGRTQVMNLIRSLMVEIRSTLEAPDEGSLSSIMVRIEHVIDHRRNREFWSGDAEKHWPQLQQLMRQVQAAADDLVALQSPPRRPIRLQIVSAIPLRPDQISALTPTIIDESGRGIAVTISVIRAATFEQTCVYAKEQDCVIAVARAACDRLMLPRDEAVFLPLRNGHPSDLKVFIPWWRTGALAFEGATPLSVPFTTAPTLLGRPAPFPGAPRNIPMNGGVRIRARWSETTTSAHWLSVIDSNGQNAWFPAQALAMQIGLRRRLTAPVRCFSDPDARVWTGDLPANSTVTALPNSGAVTPVISGSRFLFVRAGDIP